MGNIIIKRFAAEFTRAAGTVTYAAQDVVGSVTSGTTALPLLSLSAGDLSEQSLVPGGSYQVKNLKLTKSTKTTTNASFDCYLFSSGVVETYHDNQEFGLKYENKHIRIGKVSFTLATAGTTNSDCAEYVATDVNLTFKANTANPYFILVATSAYAPGASEKFYLEAEIIKIN